MNKPKLKRGRGINNGKSWLQIAPKIIISQQDYAYYRIGLVKRLVTQEKLFNDLVQTLVAEGKGESSINGEIK